MTINVADFLGKVTLSDGAWGTELDKLGCPPGYCRERWNLEKPDLVAKVAASYVAAGSEIILTNTFGANRHVLSRHGCEDQVRALNRAGAEISKRAANGRALVFGSMGPSGTIVVMGEVTEEELFTAFKDQAEGLAEGGADGLVVETMTELAEVKAAVRAAHTTGLPVVGCMTFDSGPDKTSTLMGVTPEEAVDALSVSGADIVGCNCGIGIDNYIIVTGKMRAVSDKPIWVKANAGMPVIEEGRVTYRMTPEEFAAKTRQLVEAGANIVGGCCGTSPQFISALTATLK